MKVSVAISIIIHIFVFSIIILNLNAKKMYDNDIALYFDNNYDITSRDLSIQQKLVQKYKKTENSKSEKDEISNNDMDNNNNDSVDDINVNGSDIEEYIDAIGNGVINGIKLAIPQYPALAKKRGLKGTTVVDISIRGDGSIENVYVVVSSGERILDNAVKETIIKMWRLPPLNKSVVVRKIFEFDLLD